MTQQRSSSQPPAVLGASLISACGSLPAQILPLIIVFYLSQGVLSLTQIGWLSGVMLLGQTVGSLTYPVYSDGVLGRRETLGLILASFCALTLAPWTGFAGNLMCWFVVGFCASGMQYIGLVSATRAPDPSAALSLRLSVALSFSGVMLIASASLPEAPAWLVLTSVAVFQALVVLGAMPLARLRRMARRGGQFAGFTGVRLGIAIWIIPCFGMFISLLSFLPVSLQGQGRSGHDVLLMMGLARLAAAPILFVLQGRGSLLPERVVFAGFAVLTVVLFAGVVRPGFWLPVLCLVGFEAFSNVLSARFLGEISRRHAPSETRWLSSYIQLGAGTAHVVTGYVLASQLQDAYFAVLVVVFLPLIWSVTAGRHAPREGSANQADP